MAIPVPATDFDRIMIVDWSASTIPSPRRPSPDAIWVAEAAADRMRCWYLRTRSQAMDLIETRIQRALESGERLLCGFDFPFGYPAGFALELTGAPSALAVWANLARRIEDDARNHNNRFDVAEDLNACFGGLGPFWGCPAQVDLPGLPQKGNARHGHGMRERRAVEHLVARAQTCWKLFTTGSVGSQALLGQARLHHLRAKVGADMQVWPFEAGEAPIVLAEIYPSLLADLVRRAEAENPGVIRDNVQVRLLAAALLEMGRGDQLSRAFGAARTPDLSEEGWILGVGCQAELEAAAQSVLDRIDFTAAPLQDFS